MHAAADVGDVGRANLLNIAMPEQSWLISHRFRHFVIKTITALWLQLSKNRYLNVQLDETAQLSEKCCTKSGVKATLTSKRITVTVK